MTTNISSVNYSRDYSIFKIIPYNRAISESRILDLQDSISQHGFVLPILVNQNMFIVDGQHRFEAGRKNGVEIPFLVYDIDDDLLPILISKVNSVSKNWSRYDYFRMWCNLEKEPYLYLSDLSDNHKIKLETMFVFISYIFVKKNKISPFQNGTFTLTESQREKLELKLKEYLDLINCSLFHDFNKKALNRAIAILIRNPKYLHSRMMCQIEKFGGEIGNTASSAIFIEQFESVYNKRMRTNKVSFSRDS